MLAPAETEKLSAGLLTSQIRPPAGIRIENLRRRGIDALKIHVAGTTTRHNLLRRVACLLPQLKYGRVTGRVAADRNRSGLLGTSATTIDILPNFITITGATRNSGKTAGAPFNFAFWDVQDIRIRIERGVGRLDLITARETISIGSGLPRSTLGWLGDLLVLEFAGLSWRPLHGVDRYRSRERAGGKFNPYLLKLDLALRIYGIFTKEAPDVIRGLEQAIACGDHKTARARAHWLKSACASVGARRCSDLCQLMQIRAAAGDMHRADSLLKEICVEFNGTMSQLRSICSAAAGNYDGTDSAAETSPPDAGLTEHAVGSAVDAGPGTLDVADEKRSIIEASVLVVDDSSVSREIAQEYLGDIVRRTEIARDGHEAIERWKTGTFDLILMDCEMLGMDGFECARQIRRTESLSAATRTPIIAVTAHALRRDQERCTAVGMDDYLSKPYLPEELGEKVRGWLLRSEARSEPTGASPIPVLPKIELEGPRRRRDAGKRLL